MLNNCVLMSQNAVKVDFSGPQDEIDKLFVLFWTMFPFLLQLCNSNVLSMFRLRSSNINTKYELFRGKNLLIIANPVVNAF